MCFITTLVLKFKHPIYHLRTLTDQLRRAVPDKSKSKTVSSVTLFNACGSMRILVLPRSQKAYTKLAFWMDAGHGGSLQSTAEDTQKTRPPELLQKAAPRVG